MLIFFLFLVFTFLNFNNKLINCLNKSYFKYSPSFKKDDFCRCSSSFAKPRVFNGTKVVAFQYEWVVAIYSTKFKKLLCTGSLLSETTVLTVAHCIFKKDINDLQILAGSINNFEFSVDTDWGSKKVKKIYLHPMFLQTERIKLNPYDIAIIKLKEPFELGFNNSIYLACILENEINKPENYDYYFAGYGAVLPFILRYNIEKNTIETTKKTYLESLSTIKLNYDLISCNFENKFKDFFCLRSETGSLCSKDSGGGIHIFIEDKMVLLGVQVNFGIFIYNETTKLNCFQASTSYSVKVHKHLNFLNQYGEIKCKINNFFN